MLTEREMTPGGSAAKRRKSRGTKMLQAMGVELPVSKKQRPSPVSGNRAEMPSPAPSDSQPASAPRKTLPMKYSELLKILENLLLAYRIRPKGQMFSFANAKRALSKMNIRMDIKQLAQIIYLCPALTWENVQTARDMTPREKLMISIPHLNNPKSSVHDEAIIRALRERLVEFVSKSEKEGGQLFEVPEAALPDPSCSITNTPTGSSKRSSGSRSVMSPYFRSPSSVRGPNKFSTPVKSAERRAKRALFMSPLPKVLRGRLTPVVEGAEAAPQGSIGENAPLGDSEQKAGDDSEAFQTPARRTKTPVCWDDEAVSEEIKRLQESSEVGVLSSASKQVIRETMQQQDLMSPEQVLGRKKGHALSILPETFDLVRAVFHREKATMMNVEMVIEKMRTSQGGRRGPTDDTIRFNLHQVLEHASPYLKLESSGPKSNKMLVIDNSADLKKIRDHLKQVSKHRDSLDQAPPQQQG